jgi:hypothetical protein
MSSRSDAIVALARNEARCLRPHRYIEDDETSDVHHTLPYIQVEKNGRSGAYSVSGHAFSGHDNELRMPFLCEFLSQRVIPLIDPQVNVSGLYRIELHDSYSYLPMDTHPRSMYDNCMVFSRNRNARENSALIPDPFHMSGFGGMLNHCDTVPWKQKESKLFFAGTTTGDCDPLRNERVRACVWSLSHKNVCDFRLTKVAQMTPERLFRVVPEARALVKPYVLPRDHFRYRYQVNIVGNTACWSRLPMIMNSSCVMLNLRNDEIMWYYPLIMSGTHFVEAEDLGDLLNLRKRLDTAPEECGRITTNANAFVRDFLSSPATAATYMANLLEESILHHM